nr:MULTISPECIES: hypothetical protein [Methylobacterium]
MDTYHRWIEVVVPATLSGCPTICLPLAPWAQDGRSSGLQLIGRPRQGAALHSPCIRGSELRSQRLPS